jgi:hypothetical protein
MRTSTGVAIVGCVTIGARDDLNNNSLNSFRSGEIAKIQVCTGALDPPSRSKVGAWIKTR